MNLRHFLLFPILVVIWANTAVGELYTALADLEELLQTEAVLISSLEKYIENQHQKLDLLKR